MTPQEFDIRLLQALFLIAGILLGCVVTMFYIAMGDIQLHADEPCNNCILTDDANDILLAENESQKKYIAALNEKIQEVCDHNDAVRKEALELDEKLQYANKMLGRQPQNNNA